MVKLGQHFLKNKRALKKIVGFLDLQKGDTVIEVGSGHGELTEQIANSKSQIAKIIAIEKDEQLAEELRKKFSADKNIKIIPGDALHVLKKPGFLSLVSGRYKLVGNIPYYITGKILRTIGELKNKPEISILTMQKEVAGRLAAKPPRANRLSASVQFWAEVKIAFFIPRNDFFPKPEVDSATVILKTIDRKISAKFYYAIVRAVFSQPRKTILNNISGGLGIPKIDAGNILKKAGVGESLRPQNLSIENVVKIAESFFGKK